MKKTSSVTKKLLNRFTFFSYNLDSPEYLENFLISAVVAVVVIRIFLSITGYPQIGTNTLHIAHMLWGGFLMVLALVLAIAFLNKEARHLSAIIGGLGFGTFIDEIGKFITSDNNYFFQPSFALMYIIFVFLYLTFRFLFSKFRPRKRDYAMNALEIIKEVVLYDLDEQEKKKALFYLSKSDKRNNLINGLEKILKTKRTLKSTEVQIVAKIKNYLLSKYAGFIKRKKFAKVVAAIFIVTSMINIVNALFDLSLLKLTFWNLGAIICTLITGIFSVFGTYFLFQKKRILAYEKFKTGLLVYIFLGHFFAFYHEEFSAALSLFINISVYIALQYLIDQESKLLTKA